MKAETGKGTAPLLTCDYVRARRTRRSFRLLVALTVALTLTLWFAEGYLRYDRSETQYRMSLTLHPAQARPILRTVVHRETGPVKVPPSLYLEALAQVEEPDYILETYDRAYQVNPRNASLVTNYGSKLYADGQYDEARERFREAGLNPPANVLPRYLEAAALAAALEPKAELNDLIALLTRANSSEDPILFPEPLWHVSLPQRGLLYNKKRREIADEISAPLLYCCNYITSRARQDLEEGALMDWPEWLGKLHYMGVRLMGGKEGDSRPTLIQMKTALQIQHQALVLREMSARLAGDEQPAEIAAELTRIHEALAKVEDFEEGRGAVVAQYRKNAIRPWGLLLKTALSFFLLYFVSYLIHKIGSGGKYIRALPHKAVGVLVPWFGFAALFVLLVTMSARHSIGMMGSFDTVIPLLWYVLSALMIITGLLYPIFQVRGMGYMDMSFEKKETAPDDDDDPQPPAAVMTLRRYIGVYGCLLRRYMGILCGGFLVVLCMWCVCYYLVLHAYPFQLELLSIGLSKDSAALVSTLQSYFISAR